MKSWHERQLDAQREFERVAVQCAGCGVSSHPDYLDPPCGEPFEDMMHYNPDGPDWQTGFCVRCGHGPGCHAVTVTPAEGER